MRKEYSVSDDLKILIKKGHILKNDSIKQNLELTQSGKLLYTQLRLNKFIYDEIKDKIAKMYQAITRANEDIEILEIQNNSQVINGLLIQTEIETTAENLFSELSSFIQVISAKTYETVYKILTESFYLLWLP